MTEVVEMSKEESHKQGMAKDQMQQEDAIDVTPFYLYLGEPKLKLVGLALLGLVVMMGGIGCVLWFYSPLVANHSFIRILLYLGLTVLAFMTGASKIVLLLFGIGAAFLMGSIDNLLFTIKYKGLICSLDESGFTYYEDKELKHKAWHQVIDVGSFKQSGDPLKYNYQVVFTEGQPYTFDLRGQCGTEEFKEKVENFILFYS